ncbi:MAG: hypothetical protein HY296_06725 [Thaumarchaeota archaeon]|nr:hypothetical protein [Nitrososphaerota archaeon]
MQVKLKSESKLLERTYVEMEVEGKAGAISRKDAIAAAAAELNVPAETIGLLRLEQQSGTRNVLGKFYVYRTEEARKRVHPTHLGERTLGNEEREKLRQARKKAASPAPAAEAKK